MALIWVDGFESYGDTVSTGTSGRPSPAGILARHYGEVVGETNTRVQAGRFGGKSLRFSFGSSIKTPLLAASQLFVVGAAVKRGGLAEVRVFRCYNNGVLGLHLRIGSDTPNKLEVLRGATVLDAVYVDLRQSYWNFIELKVFAHETTGYYEVRINGETVSEDTDLDTTADTNPQYTQVSFSSLNLTDSVIELDDLYVCNGAGLLNNDFLGNRRVVTLRPDADQTSDFTTVEPVGSHFEAVDESEADDETSYVEGTTGDKDIYGYDNLPSDITTVTGVHVKTLVRETGTTGYDIITVARSNATEYPDAGQPVGVSQYIARGRVLETDPDTSSLWSLAGVNAAQFGLEAV